MGGLNIQRLKMTLDVPDCAELQQVFLFDTNAEGCVRFDQNFIKAQRINSNVFHQPGFRSDGGRIGSRDSMQNLSQSSLQLLLFRERFAQSSCSEIAVIQNISADRFESHRGTS